MLVDDLFYGTKMHHKKFAELCEPIKRYLGITDVAYLNVNKDGSIVDIHSNHKWKKKYIEQHCYKIDPHMVHPDNMHAGFCMLMINDDYKYQEYNDVMLYETSHKFNFYYGFTYVTKTHSDFTALCFTTNKNNNQIINRLLNEAGIIKYFFKKLNNQVILSFPDLQQNKVDLLKIKGNLFYKQTGIVFRK